VPNAAESPLATNQIVAVGCLLTGQSTQNQEDGARMHKAETWVRQNEQMAHAMQRHAEHLI